MADLFLQTKQPLTHQGKGETHTPVILDHIGSLLPHFVGRLQWQHGKWQQNQTKPVADTPPRPQQAPVLVAGADQLKETEREKACQQHKKAISQTSLHPGGHSRDSKRQQTEQSPDCIEDNFHFCPMTVDSRQSASEQKYPGKSFNNFTESAYLDLRDIACGHTLWRDAQKFKTTQ